jgi:omega-6 fatty acid desaturase (delta-12 desaturase)
LLKVYLLNANHFLERIVGNNPSTQPKIDKINWQPIVKVYQGSDIKRSLWQVFNSLIPYIILWYLMYRSLEISYWLTLALAIPAVGFYVRTFIIFHDCGHGSFFSSKKANTILGYITGVITFTPYHQWRHDHAIHHATAGDLDRRGVGDVLTLTVDEYLELPFWKRLRYRLYRNPLVLLLLGPPLMFVVGYRFSNPTSGRRERMSVYWTNMALLAIVVGLSWVIGIKAYLLVQLPIVMIATAVGVWLFYVQHNFEGAYWVRHEQWDYANAGLKGSSYYELPKVLQWFTGNIGFHHIHHLSPLIPNYHLERCQKENTIFQQVKPLTLSSSLKSLTLRLWDEKGGKMVGYGYLKILKQRESLLS